MALVEGGTYRDSEGLSTSDYLDLEFLTTFKTTTTVTAVDSPAVRTTQLLGLVANSPTEIQTAAVVRLCNGGTWFYSGGSLWFCRGDPDPHIASEESRKKHFTMHVNLNEAMIPM